MSDHRDTFTRHADRFTAVLDGATWTASTPCTGWTVADRRPRRRHPARLPRRAGRRPRPPTGGRPGRGVGHPPRGRPAHRRRRAAPRVRRLLRAHHRRRHPGDFYGFDLVVHRWDVGRALGRDVAFDDAELDDLERSIATFGEHLYAEGICAPALPVPADAPRTTRVLALLGRRA